MMAPTRQVAVVAEVLCLHGGMIDVLVIEKDEELCLPWGLLGLEENGGESVDVMLQRGTGLDLENLWGECGYEFADEEEKEIIHWGLRSPWHVETDPAFSKKVELHYGVFFRSESLPGLSVDGAKWMPIGSVLPPSGPTALFEGHGEALKRFVRPMSSLFPWVWPNNS